MPIDKIYVQTFVLVELIKPRNNIEVNNVIVENELYDNSRTKDTNRFTTVVIAIEIKIEDHSYNITDSQEILFII